MIPFRALFFAAAVTAAPFLLHAQTPAAAPAASAAVPAAKEKAAPASTIVPFRAGSILSAELSSQKPAFDAESELDKSSIENPAWVEIVVKLDPGRTISRFDYELEGKLDTYSCLAVGEGSDGYSSDPEKWIVKKPHPLKYYRLLFPVKRDELSNLKQPLSEQLSQMSLKIKLYESALPSAKIAVRAMPDDKRFTRVSAIRPEGLCGLTYKAAFETPSK